jgi:flagellar biosynthesis/type III secretory pathway protein FliH
MSVERARVIKAVVAPEASLAAARGEAARDATGRDALARRVPRVIVDAHEQADRIVASAEAHAREIVAEATARVAASAHEAASEARALEIARVAAEVIVARASEEQRAEREIERTIELAVLLAERLIGEAIAVEPARVHALAIDALKEARGARQVRVEASPHDVAAVQQMLDELEAPGPVATVEPSLELARGSLVVHTELGRVDARLAPQLSRLAEALRELLQSRGIQDGRTRA